MAAHRRRRKRFGLPVWEYRLSCPDCGARMRLALAAPRLIYRCAKYPECHCTHLALHDGTPVGTVGDEVTRRARQDAHRALDALWKGGPMTRRQAYAWLQAALGLDRTQTHIGRFNVEECQRVVAAALAYRESV